MTDSDDLASPVDNYAIRQAAKDAVKVAMQQHDCDAETQEFRLQNDREWREKLHVKMENTRLHKVLKEAGRFIADRHCDELHVTEHQQ